MDREIDYNHRDYDREHDCWYDEFAHYYDSDDVDVQYNGNDNDIHDEVMASEYDNDDEFIHKKYFIGSYWYEIYEDDESIFIKAKTIKLTTFYNFSIRYIENHILYYISLYSNYYCNNAPIDIIQTVMNDDGTYNYISKTFWIRIIQRKWRKIMQEKKEYDKKIKKQINSLSNTFQLTTRMKNPYKGLYGMNM